MSEYAIIFDIGGVIATDLHKPLLMEIANDRYPPLERSNILRAADRPWNRIKIDSNYSEDRFWEEVIANGHLGESVPELKCLVRKRMRVFRDTVKVAENLRTQGYRVGILSNHAKPWFEELCTRFRLYDLFDKEISVVSYAIGVAKPDKKAYEVLLERLKKNISDFDTKKCIFVDDKIENVEVANSMGVIGIQFDSRIDHIEVLINYLSKYSIVLKDHNLHELRT